MLENRFTKSQLVPCSENILNYENTIATAGVKEITVHELLDMESQDHKAIQDVFAKQDAKLIDVLVKKIMFYVIQSVSSQQIVKINNY